KSGETKRDLYSVPPYKNAKGTCVNPATREYHVETWSPITRFDVPSNADLKRAICEHGPVVTAVLADNWDTRLADGSFAYSTRNPNWNTAFPRGIFTGSATSGSLSKGNIDHEVLIVGWDDNDKVWIIKNSWGKDWGDSGFMKLPYDHANVGYNAG